MNHPRFVPYEESCDTRYHPKFLGPDRARTPYWFYCRLAEGHKGDHDCPAAHEEASRR